MARPWGCAPDGKMLGSGSASPPALDRGAPAILQPSTFESSPPPPAPAGSTARGPPPVPTSPRCTTASSRGSSSSALGPRGAWKTAMFSTTRREASQFRAGPRPWSSPASEWSERAGREGPLDYRGGRGRPQGHPALLESALSHRRKTMQSYTQTRELGREVGRGSA